MNTARVTKLIIQGLALSIGLMGLGFLYLGLAMMPNTPLINLALSSPFIAIGIILISIAYSAIFKFSAKAIKNVTGTLGLIFFFITLYLSIPCINICPGIQRSMQQLALFIGLLLGSTLFHKMVAPVVTKLAFPPRDQ